MVRRDGDGEEEVSELLVILPTSNWAGCGWYMYSSTLGRCLGRTKNDRLVEVRSSCHYSALNRSHTLAHSKFAWLGVDYFGLQ
jgi:hypothetical protein